MCSAPNLPHHCLVIMGETQQGPPPPPMLVCKIGMRDVTQNGQLPGKSASLSLNCQVPLRQPWPSKSVPTRNQNSPQGSLSATRTPGSLP